MSAIPLIGEATSERSVKESMPSKYFHDMLAIGNKTRECQASCI